MLLIALVAWLAVRLAGAVRLSLARDRFEAEVGPLPRMAKPFAGENAESGILARLGGPARLPDEADLMRIRELNRRAPSSWSPAEVDGCRRVLAANAALLAAADRAAERRRTALPAVRGGSSWDPADALASRAGAQTSLLKLRIRLALRDHSYAEMRRGMDALVAEVDALETEPAMVFKIFGLTQEKGLLQAMAWVVEDRDVDGQDLAALRRLLPHRPLAAAVRQLFAGEAWYMLATDQPALSDLDLAQLLDGYRRLSLKLEQGRGATRQEPAREPRPPAHPASLPAAILALTGPNFEAVADQVAATLAARQLAELALDLRLAAARGCAYPESLDTLPLGREPDPFTARRPRYVRDARGGALLSNPSAAAAWDALPHGAKTKPPPYDWRLPPPCAPPAASRGSS